MRIIDIIEFNKLLDNKLSIKFLLDRVLTTYKIEGDIFVWNPLNFNTQIDKIINVCGWSSNVTVIEGDPIINFNSTGSISKPYIIINIESPEQLAKLINKLDKLKMLI